MKSYHDNWRNFLTEATPIRQDDGGPVMVDSSSLEEGRYTAEALTRVAEDTGVNPAWLWGLMGAESGGGRGKFRGGKCQARAFNNYLLKDRWVTYESGKRVFKRGYTTIYNEDIKAVRNAGVRTRGQTYGDSRKDRSADSQFHKCFKVAPKSAIAVAAWGANQVMGFNIKEMWENDPQGFYDRWYGNNGANQCAMSEEASRVYNAAPRRNAKLQRYSNNAVFGGINGAYRSWQSIVQIYHGSSPGSEKNTRYVSSARKAAKQFIAKFPNQMRQWWKDRGKSEEEINTFFRRWRVNPGEASVATPASPELPIEPVSEIKHRKILVIGDSNTARMKAALTQKYGGDPNTEIKVWGRGVEDGVATTTKYIYKNIKDPNSKLKKLINNFNPTHIVIGSLGGNDWAYACPGREETLQSYIKNYVKPLMIYIKAHNGSWGGLPPAGPEATRKCKGKSILFQPMRAKINDRYKQVAEDIGLEYRDVIGSGFFNPPGDKYHIPQKKWIDYFKDNTLVRKKIKKKFPLRLDVPGTIVVKTHPPHGTSWERPFPEKGLPWGMKWPEDQINLDISQIDDFEVACHFWNNPEHESFWGFTNYKKKGMILNREDPYGEIHDAIEELWEEAIASVTEDCPEGTNCRVDTTPWVTKQINKRIKRGDLESPVITHWKTEDIIELFNKTRSRYPTRWKPWFKAGMCDGDYESKIKSLLDQEEIEEREREKHRKLFRRMMNR